MLNETGRILSINLHAPDGQPKSRRVVQVDQFGLKDIFDYDWSEPLIENSGKTVTLVSSEDLEEVSLESGISVTLDDTNKNILAQGVTPNFHFRGETLLAGHSVLEVAGTEPYEFSNKLPHQEELIEAFEGRRTLSLRPLNAAILEVDTPIFIPNKRSQKDIIYYKDEIARRRMSYISIQNIFERGTRGQDENMREIFLILLKETNPELAKFLENQPTRGNMLLNQ